ncbi:MULTISPECIES: RNA chaperone ProQ [Shewanella]|uniref:RNA chaperone ProQ n=1 Tax=Shewanella pneumatophori TaxID=314092 RepID=A0A9X1ZD29_9GAMM|nr:MULTISPECIES: RNA chaperone ProQ [Shewanella]MCK8045522.1 RNA chaperone ProQ [Shewanella sp. 1CM18E]MCL1137140.1 RNA chaperone ProQ [Shewanella pneumatophori]
MESTEKLTDTNAILAYLYETFPLCFIAEGETKPLKIGLFQDLAERLADDSKVSKTQLRIALRRYTSSWRYLKCVKAGAQRIDLDGNDCGELEQEHVDHAAATLKESQEKAKAKRVAQAKNANPAKVAKKPVKKPVAKRPKPAPASKPVKEAVVAENLTPAVLAELKANQRVNVKLGKAPVAGVILDIKKEDVQVQLDSGLTIKVRVEHILL